MPHNGFQNTVLSGHENIVQRVPLHGFTVHHLPYLGMLLYPYFCLGIILDVVGLTTHKIGHGNNRISIHGPYMLRQSDIRYTCWKCWTAYVRKGFNLNTTNSCLQIIWWLHGVYCDISRISYTNYEKSNDGIIRKSTFASTTQHLKHTCATLVQPLANSYNDLITLRSCKWESLVSHFSRRNVMMIPR